MNRERSTAFKALFRVLVLIWTISSLLNAVFDGEPTHRLTSAAMLLVGVWFYMNVDHTTYEPSKVFRLPRHWQGHDIAFVGVPLVLTAACLQLRGG